MSTSTSTLRIRSADTTAQIKVLDGAANVVANGIGELDARLADGLYKIRVRVGSEFQERLVALDTGLPQQHFDQIDFPTPIPVNNTARSHEYHQAAIWDAWSKPATRWGSGSWLLISAREWSRDNSRAHPDPAAALSIILPSGDKVAFAEIATIRKKGDAYAIGAVEVDPGLYQVELALPDGSRLRRALHASPGWMTQLYMLFRDTTGQSLPDLSGGSVAIARQPVVHDEQARLAEISLDALTQHRAILSEQMRQILRDKFEQPLLGLIGAHLLLREPNQAGLFRVVMKNLTKMLGAKHPDVSALRTRLRRAAAASVSEPPMLRASWDLLVEASGHNPELIVPNSDAGKIAEFIVPGRGWLVWQPPAHKQDTSRIDARLEVLRAYVQAQSQARTPSGFPSDMLASAESAEAPADLDEASRADLSRALGMPRMTLDDMLKRL